MTTIRKLTSGAAALAALVTVTACGGPTNEQANAAPPNATTSPSATAAHNDVDVMFAQHMIPHHQQAIEMSDIVLAKQGIDLRVIQLAGQIKAAQAPEIEQMQGWLDQWGQPSMPNMPGHSMMPSPTEMPGMPGMPGHSMMPTESGMPGRPDNDMMPGMDGMSGMMSEQDMNALRNAQGIDASKLFLQQMITHHQGAIMMAQHEISAGQYPDTVALARSIESSQQQEINTMQGILGSL